jgi:hypothetical protein
LHSGLSVAAKRGKRVTRPPLEDWAQRITEFPGNKEKYREFPYPLKPEIAAHRTYRTPFAGFGWCSDLRMNREFLLSIRDRQFLITN